MKTSLITLLILSNILSLSGQNRKVYIEGHDRMRYSVEKITVAPGTEVELTLKTVSDLPKSQMAHNWLLLRKEADVDEFVNQSTQHEENGYIDPDQQEQILAHTGMLGGGEQETIEFKAPAEKGKYTYVCTFPSHYIAGMKGILVVE